MPSNRRASRREYIGKSAGWLLWYYNTVNWISRSPVTDFPIGSMVLENGESEEAAMDGEPLVLRRDTDGIVWLTLNRPAARNALSVSLMGELQAALDAAANDAGARVVVIAGAGPGFCAGHDLRELRANSGRQYYEAVFAQCARLMTSIVRLPKPVIARVHGVATAAGCQLVASCDLAIASDTARFATPGVNIGLFCSTPMVPVARSVGRKRALEMLFTGEMIDAQTALEWGLVNRVVPADALDGAVDELAARLVRSSASVLALGKRAFYSQDGLREDAAYDLTCNVMVENAGADDAHEGMRAFLEKRTPRWSSPDV